MEISFDKIIKRKKIKYHNDEKYRQTKELFLIFLGYIKAHHFDDGLIKKLCNIAVSNSFYSVLSCGYTWRDYDYTTHYMIHIRWLYYLITAHKSYPLVYDVDLVKTHFYQCLQYSSVSHSEKISNIDFIIKKRWYRNRVDDFFKKLGK